LGAGHIKCKSSPLRSHKTKERGHTKKVIGYDDQFDMSVYAMQEQKYHLLNRLRQSECADPPLRQRDVVDEVAHPPLQHTLPWDEVQAIDWMLSVMMIPTMGALQRRRLFKCDEAVKKINREKEKVIDHQNAVHMDTLEMENEESEDLSIEQIMNALDDATEICENRAHVFANRSTAVCPVSDNPEFKPWTDTTAMYFVQWK
ncbi:hypothetical protein RFI_04583, partial [Reticulomyxa filosa]